MNATPDEVFAVLADPIAYDQWVVGAKEVRHADPTWPDAGALLHHTVGVGPVALKDSTKVIASEAPGRLLLQARGRPLGIAHIEFRLVAERGGTLVRLREWVVKPRVLAALNPVLDPLVRVRNAETLRRLTDVVSKSRRTEATPDR